MKSLSKALSYKPKNQCDEFIIKCSKLEHPNIVHMIGIYPSACGLRVPNNIVMSHFFMSLTECLRKYPQVPTQIERSILLDVANGLKYLHGQDPPIVHCHLTANNVLLTSHMQAKISDFWQAMFLGEQCELSMDRWYVPPEACSGEIIYHPKTDIFSFGVLILHVATHEWPSIRDLLTKEAILQKRVSHLGKLEGERSLRVLAEFCLSDDPKKRPNSCELVEDFTTKCSPRFTNTLEMALALDQLETRLQEVNIDAEEVVGNSAPKLILGFKAPNDSNKHDLQLSFPPQSTSKQMDVIVRPPLVIHFTGTLVGTINGIQQPWGVVAGGRGRIFVTNHGENIGVLSYHRTGKFCGKFVPSLTMFDGSVEGMCYYPQGIDMDGEEGFILADTGCHRIQRFKLNHDFSEVESKESVGAGQFKSPNSARVSKENGDVYVCDTGNHRIQVFNRTLMFKSSVSKFGTQSFHDPVDIGFDSHGNIYIADVHYAGVLVFNKQFEFQHTVGQEESKEKAPRYICIDRHDYVYVANCIRNCVQVFNPARQFVMQVKLPQLSQKNPEPRGISVDEEGFVYVSCKGTGCVHIYK